MAKRKKELDRTYADLTNKTEELLAQIDRVVREYEAFSDFILHR